METNSNLFSRCDEKRLTSKGKYPPGNESISQKKTGSSEHHRLKSAGKGRDMLVLRRVDAE